MARPLVIAYHIGGTGYGHLLPNDPRGSGSTRVASQKLAQLGEVHHGRKPVQPSGREIRAFYEQARDLLNHPTLLFGLNEVAIIGAAFADVIERQRYTCYACAIMPDHFHILIRKHRDQAEQMEQYYTGMQIAH